MNTNLDISKQVEYRANPTQADIPFGCGDIQYKFISFEQVVGEDGSLKRLLANESGCTLYC